MITLILFAVFSQISFFVGLVFGGIGLAADFSLIKSLLRKMGILRPAQETKPSEPPKENYMKKSPLTTLSATKTGLREFCNISANTLTTAIA